VVLYTTQEHGVEIGVELIVVLDIQLIVINTMLSWVNQWVTFKDHFLVVELMLAVIVLFKRLTY
jgi:hypothetical protein